MESPYFLLGCAFAILVTYCPRILPSLLFHVTITLTTTCIIPFALSFHALNDELQATASISHALTSTRHACSELNSNITSLQHANSRLARSLNTSKARTAQLDLQVSELRHSLREAEFLIERYEHAAQLQGQRRGERGRCGEAGGMTVAQHGRHARHDSVQEHSALLQSYHNRARYGYTDFMDGYGAAIATDRTICSMSDTVFGCGAVGIPDCSATSAGSDGTLAGCGEGDTNLREGFDNLADDEGVQAARIEFMVRQRVLETVSRAFEICREQGRFRPESVAGTMAARENHKAA